MNSLSSLDETYGEYSVAPTVDLVRFWRSKVKNADDCRGGEGICVDAQVSKSIFWFMINLCYIILTFSCACLECVSHTFLSTIVSYWLERTSSN